MLDLLLYSTLSCSDARDLISRVDKHEELPDPVKVEIVETIKDSVQERDFCNWDAND